MPLSHYDATVAEAMDRIMQASENVLSVKCEIRVPVVEMSTVYLSPQQVGTAVRDKPPD
jgi:hypothetical protein